MYFHFDCFYFRLARARQSDVVQMWQINSTIGNSSVLSVSGVRLGGGAAWTEAGCVKRLGLWSTFPTALPKALPLASPLMPR